LGHTSNDETDYRRRLQRTGNDDNSQTDALTENGDRLSCADFERRYQAMPQVKQESELVSGVAHDIPVTPQKSCGELATET